MFYPINCMFIYPLSTAFGDTKKKDILKFFLLNNDKLKLHNYFQEYEKISTIPNQKEYHQEYTSAK